MVGNEFHAKFWSVIPTRKHAETSQRRCWNRPIRLPLHAY